MLTHKGLKKRALNRGDVKAEYERLDKEFALLDETLKALAAVGIAQTEIAEHIATPHSGDRPACGLRRRHRN